MREQLGFQTEVVINTVYIGALMHKRYDTGANSNVGGQSNAYELREVVLESLRDLCRLPWFFAELFANYDCNPEASDLLTNLMMGLCKGVFPSSGFVTGNHLLALDCLMQGLRWIKLRGQRLGLSPSTPGYPAAAPLRVPGGDIDWTGASPDTLAAVLQERCSFKARLRPCIEEFNKNHKKGVQLLVAALGLSASAVADFKFDPKMKASAKV
jgi:Sec7-like guanine-nucleotide exchange factor